MISRRALAPLIALPLIAASPADSPEVTERLARVKTLFVGEATCPPADRKACTKACTAAVLKPYRYDTPGAAACELVGDIWMNGQADVKKPMPEVGLKSYADACTLGQAPACEKEAAYHEKAGDFEKALQIRVAACLKDFEPACLAASKTIDDHAMPYPQDAKDLAVRGHVHACDELQVAESCTWLEGHPELAEARRKEVAALRETEVATISSEHGSVQITQFTDPTPYLDTHRVVWTWHPVSQDPETGKLDGMTCHEVYIPTAAKTEVALAATFAHALLRKQTWVDPSLIQRSIVAPRGSKSGCDGEILQIAVK